MAGPRRRALSVAGSAFFPRTAVPRARLTMSSPSTVTSTTTTVWRPTTTVRRPTTTVFRHRSFSTSRPSYLSQPDSGRRTPAVVPPGYRKVNQRVTLFGVTLFTRGKIVKDRRVKVKAETPPSPTEKAEEQEYELSRLKWLDLVEAAPPGSVAHVLRMIATPLYEIVGEVGGKGIGKTFADNKSLFYSAATVDSIVAWAEYETVTIGSATYTSCFTKVAGRAVTEAGRAWLLWLCHCAETGHTTVDDYVLTMNEHHPWDTLGILERAGIRAVAELNSKVAAVVPPNPVSPAPTLEEM